jgi:pilus assembly protein Flp/PilA
MKAILGNLKKFLSDEHGVTSIEYALLASLIAVIIVGTVRTLGVQLCSEFYNKIVAAFGGAAQAC